MVQYREQYYNMDIGNIYVEENTCPSHDINLLLNHREKRIKRWMIIIQLMELVGVLLKVGYNISKTVRKLYPLWSRKF